MDASIRSAHVNQPATAAESAVLSPADVRHKVFTTVRLREGYDPAEVERFRTDVDATLTALLQQISELRGRLDSAAGQTEDTALPSPAEIGEKAARVVALAQSTADRVITDAHQEARDILEEARSHAEAVDRQAADRAARLEQEIREHRAAMAELDGAREAEEERVRNLRSLAATYREHLDGLAGPIAELRALLDQLDGRGDADHALVPAVPAQPSPPTHA